MPGVRRLVALARGRRAGQAGVVRRGALLGPADRRLGLATPAVLVVGLAPAANGGNRTGRIFTGDRSGDWLFASLHRVGLADQPTTTHAGDGQRLVDTRMVAAVRCAPPDNRPTTDGARHVRALARARGRPGAPPGARRRLPRRLRLGRRAARLPRRSGTTSPGPSRASATAPRPWSLAPTAAPVLLGCYHPSQQNTFTGRLTEPMLDAVLGRAAALAVGLKPAGAPVSQRQRKRS